MHYLNGTETDVYFNLALEEYLFTHYRENDCLLLWKNDPALVVGKYQNVFEEVNVKEAEGLNVKIARRITGGGTVYHDSGNLNYSLITDFDPDQFSDYDPFLLPVIEALNQLGIPAVKRNHSDIAIGDKKISGSAQTVRSGRILHHGTLLFDAELHSLKAVLAKRGGTFSSKAVTSVPSQVTNVKEHLADGNMTADGMCSYLIKRLAGENRKELVLSERQVQLINQLKNEKYGTWQWNYGKSPPFSFFNTRKVKGRQVSVKLFVEQGIMIDCQFWGTGDIVLEDQVRALLCGQRYGYASIRQAIADRLGPDQAELYTDCLI